MEIATTIPAQTSLDSRPVLQDIEQHDHRNDQNGKGEVRMVRAKVSDLKENIFKRADG
jgi:hypothetical protein